MNEKKTERREHRIVRNASMMKISNLTTAAPEFQLFVAAVR
jgi:hypothetical protein